MKHWYGEAQRVDPIEDAAVPTDHHAVILMPRSRSMAMLTPP
jgi:hypothetical protein